MTDSTIEKLQRLRAQIEALPPASKLLVASQIWQKDPELACAIADTVVMEYRAAKLLRRVGP